MITNLIHAQVGEENVAAVVIEPIQGEGGFIVPPDGFLPGLAEYCRANGIVFVAAGAARFARDVGRGARFVTPRARGVALRQALAPRQQPEQKQPHCCLDSPASPLAK